MFYCITSSELWTASELPWVYKLYSHGCSDTVVPDRPESGRSPRAVRTRGAWPAVHRLAIFRQPVVVSLLAKQASCVQHLRPFSTIGVKKSHIARLNTLRPGHCCWFNVISFPSSWTRNTTALQETGKARTVTWWETTCCCLAVETA